MKILITGATGLIGSQVIKDALSQGIEVNFLTTKRIRTVNENKLKGYYWSPENSYIENLECFEKVDTLIHLAGSRIDKRWTKSYKKKILESRVKSLEFLLDVIQSNKFPVNHLVSASAIGCYPSSKFKEFDENEPTKTDNFISKVVNDWEMAANKFRSIGIAVSIIRIGLVVSAKGGFFRRTVESTFFYKIAVIFGEGKQFQSWIHIKDVSEIFLFISKNKLLGIYNAVAPNPITNFEMVNCIKNQFYEILANKNFETFTGKWFTYDYLGFKKKLLVYFTLKVPKQFFQFIFGEMHSILFSSQKVSSEKIQNAGYSFKYTNFENAIINLDK
tara:strand:- start:1623 stop:2615 length:993 start_codon:yes stop_codon:yes gene_type:complete